MQILLECILVWQGFLPKLHENESNPPMMLVAIYGTLPESITSSTWLPVMGREPWTSGSKA